MKLTPLVVKTKSNAYFPVVAIGTSAGGLESLKQFFTELPEKSGCAYIIIQHLSPNFKSLMPEILTRQTTLKIRTAKDGMLVKPNLVYLLPPKKNLLISDSRLILQDRNKNVQVPNKPIDLFFCSLAKERGRNAIGVIMSGSGSDGALGLEAIYDAGGLVIVENPDNAKFSGMPNSAIDTKKVGIICDPIEIPKKILAHITESCSDHKPTITKSSKVTEKTYNSEEKQILQLVTDHYNVDFSKYKVGTIKRRLCRRAQILGIDRMEHYLNYIFEQQKEVTLLYNDLLIGVTSFFRDLDAFSSLKNRALPQLFSDIKTGAELRIWVPGCASGEEAYSLAILLLEYIRERNLKANFKVFATDIDEESLSIASNSPFKPEVISEIPKAYLKKYFQHSNGGHWVKPEVRNSVVFARHNVFADPPFTKLDMISCRNLLIYLDLIAQKQALSFFYYSLKVHGILFLGPSETLGKFELGYKPIDRKWKIFQKKEDKGLYNQLRVQFNTPSRVPSTVTKNPPLHLLPEKEKRLSLNLAKENLLQHYVPPSLLVDDKLNILHVYGDASQYINPKPGEMSSDLRRMLSKNLSTAIMTSIQQVKKKKTTVDCNGILVHKKEKEVVCDVSVCQVVDDESVYLPTYLVSLKDRKLTSNKNKLSSKARVSQEQIGRIKVLETELQNTKEDLQSTVEELETTNEELQSTNEELLSSNEELQSTNEELHSVNEELHTVNAEYQNKIDELSQLKEDEENLLAATEIGTIFLDTERRIRKFTPVITETIHILPQDIGRPIDHLTYEFSDITLIDLIKKVETSTKPIEKEIKTNTGQWYLLRIKPYLARKDDSITGIILTLVNIDSVKRAEEIHHATFNTTPNGLLIINEKGHIESANNALNETFGYEFGELNDLPVEVLIPKRYREPHARYRSIYIRNPEKRKMGMGRELWGLRKDGKEFPLEIGLSPFKFGNKTITLASVIDISVHKEEQQQIIKNQEQLKNSNKSLEQFAYLVSHDIQAPIRHISHYTQILESEIRDASNEMQNAFTGLKTSTERVRSMTEGLLSLARLERHPLRREKVNIKEIIDECLEICDVDNSKKESIFDIRSFPKVDADPMLARQLFQNLISNALKFCPKNRKPKIVIGADKNRGGWVFYIKDNGIGIDKNEQKNVYQVFRRASNARDLPGTGIGLSTCQRIIERHGGKIKMKSKPSIGTTFHFTLDETSGEIEGLE